jgi:hypothetical protein
MRRSDVFPAPSGPINPNNSPSFTEKDTPRKAGTDSFPFLYDFIILFTVIMKLIF